MPAGWETVEVLRSDDAGAWVLVERGGSYREPGERAMMWRANPGSVFVEMLLDEDAWIAERLQPPFQRLLAHGPRPHPYIVVERVRGITGRQRLEHGPLSIGEALRIGVFLCRALAELENFTNSAGEAVPLRGTCLGLDDLWLTPRGPRLRNPMRLARNLTRGPSGPMDIDLLAPEQIRAAPPGEPERDVYAVAIAVLSLLMGRSPFLRETARDTLAAVLSPEPSLPLDGLPETLSATLLRALDPNPNKRPPNAAALETAWLEVARAHSVTLPETLAFPDEASSEWLFR